MSAGVGAEAPFFFRRGFFFSEGAVYSGGTGQGREPATLKTEGTAEKDHQKERQPHTLWLQRPHRPGGKGTRNATANSYPPDRTRNRNRKTAKTGTEEQGQNGPGSEQLPNRWRPKGSTTPGDTAGQELDTWENQAKQQTSAPLPAADGQKETPRQQAERKNTQTPHNTARAEAQPQPLPAPSSNKRTKHTRPRVHTARPNSHTQQEGVQQKSVRSP